MVTKKEKAQESERSGSGARGKPHTGGGRDQQRGGKKASSGDRSKGGGQPGGGKTGRPGRLTSEFIGDWANRTAESRRQ